ncbi:MAG: universal stress protein [Deltaproteobacteria bacterium]|nr:universal stress protein [Deltaproteobacteria bacterium]
MSKIQKIVSAFDMSDYSEKALIYACKLADDLKAEIVIVNVVNQRDVDIVYKLTKQYMNDMTIEDYIKNQEKDRIAIIDNLLKNKTDIQYRKIIKVGIPFVELINAIKEEKADLAVMGTKGRSNIVGAILGTTAEKMFRKCPVPLLSVRRDD